MAPRKTSSSPARKKTTRTTSTRRRSRKPQPTAFELSLRPEHQRELFALALIGIALLTGIFFMTGTAGGVGSIYVLGVKQAFGGGALLLPLLLGAFGLVIMLQERFRESPLTGASVLGVMLLMAMLLMMLEFPLHHVALTDPARFGEGGGIVGYTLVDLFDALFGRPATVFLSVMLFLLGVLLALNLTLVEALTGMARGLHTLLAAVVVPPTEQPRPAASKRAQKPEHPPAPPAPTDSSDELEPTPIAARLTRASLFRRGDNSAPESKRSKPATPSAEPTTPETPLPAAPQETSPSKGVSSAEQTRLSEVVQESLDSVSEPTVYRAWPLPRVDMLETPREGGITDEERRLRAKIIEETLQSFKVEARVVGVNTGPAVTQFELQPAVGVKISKITSLERDLALSLAAPSIRIEAPIPGKAVVGIEIPNSAISLVSLREVIDSEEFDHNRGKLKLPLGKDVSGMPVIADMARMPHLLVAGSTGSGKSVAINAFLCGLLLKHTPDDLKLIMVDPKMVELIVYNRIPHLLSPVVTELERVVPTLRWAVREMERRYKVFARYSCRNLDSYRQLGRKRAELEPMPYILIIIDELADLMMMAPDEIETYICRLAQMARATGIHLIIATQRPSVDVITGLIKANFPSRMAFAVSSQVDSRVILDTPGADQLLGRGDMLYIAADAAKLVRIQGTFVSDAEIEQIVAFWRNALPPDVASDEPPASQPARQPQLAAPAASGAQPPEQANDAPAPTPSAGAELAFDPPAAFLSDSEQDELLPQARELVQQHTRASASLLQRRLRIGYSKAAQLIDLLEQQGVVGPAEGGRSREVLMRTESD